MNRLGMVKLRARRALDFTILSRVLTPHWQWSAYPSASAWSRGEKPIGFEVDGWKATFYVVEYRLPTILVSPVGSMASVTVCFDTSLPTYPFAAPTTRVVSTPVPWNSHVSSGGVVCLGAIWEEARGRMALCQLVLHVLKLLNFDEPPHDEGGYAPAANDHWAAVLSYQPLNRGVRYPTMPTGLYDGSLRAPVPPMTSGFGRELTPRFRPIY